MNPFENINTSITEAKVINKDFDKSNPHKNIPGHDCTRRMFSSSNSQNMITESVNTSNSAKHMTYTNIMESYNEHTRRAHNNMYGEIKTGVFKKIINDIFLESLLIDKDFIVSNSKYFTNLVETYIDQNGGYNFLTERIQKTKSPLLEKIDAHCKRIALEATTKKVEDKQEDIDFNSYSDDVKNAEKELSVDELSSMVKDKVLTVVKDEKSKQMEEEKLTQELEDEISNNVSEDENVSEALNKFIVQINPIKEETLFSSLMHSAYVDILNECNGESVNVDMDMVLATTITNYTLMETLYTIGLEDFSTKKIQNIVHKILN